jgi:hypothetical protein
MSYTDFTRQHVRRVMGAVSRAHLGYVGVVDTHDDAVGIIQLLGAPGYVEVHQRLNADDRWAWFVWWPTDPNLPAPGSIYPWPAALIYAKDILPGFAAAADGEAVSNDTRDITDLIRDGVSSALTVAGA